MARRLRPTRPVLPYSYFKPPEPTDRVVVERTETSAVATDLEPERSVWPWVALLSIALLALLAYLALREDEETATPATPPRTVVVTPTPVASPVEPPPAAPPVIVQPPAPAPPPTVIVQQPPAPAPSPYPS